MHERDHDHAHRARNADAQDLAVTPGRASASSELEMRDDPIASGIVQRKNEAGADEALDDADVHAVAQEGVTGAGGQLPFGEAIQRSFGRHDVSGITAHTDSNARGANEAMGSAAYAMGESVAFGGSPDLHTVAHEAAHVVQQRGGVQLKGGVGKEGDDYERHADAVADLVVRGESAESLLDQMAGGSGGGVQQKRVRQAGRPLPSWILKVRDQASEKPAAKAAPTAVQHKDRVGSTRLAGKPNEETTQILDQGDDGARSVGPGVSLPVVQDLAEVQQLIGMVNDHTMTLRHAASVDTKFSASHNKMAGENDQVIQALGAFQMQTTVAQVDIAAFEGTYNTLQSDWGRLQGMMSAYHAQFPAAGGKDKASIASNPTQAGKQVTGGATEHDTNRAVTDAEDGVQRGLEQRLDRCKDAIKGLSTDPGSPKGVAAASRSLSEANQGLLVGGLNVRLGPAKREDDKTEEKDLIAAREKVNEINKQLAGATKQVSSLTSVITDAIKMTQVGDKILTAVEMAKAGASAVSPDVAEAVDGDALTEKLTGAITGLGNQLANAKGLLDAYEGSKANYQIIHQFGEWELNKQTLENASKTFAAQIVATTTKRAEALLAVRDLDAYCKQHKVQGPKGKDIAMLTGFVTAANMYVNQANLAEEVGNDTTDRLEKSLEAQKGTGTDFNQSKQRVENPDGHDPHVDVPGVKTREIRWNSCIAGRSGGTGGGKEVPGSNKPVAPDQDANPEYSFIAAQQTTRMHLTAQGQDSERVESVLPKVDSMMGNIFVSRAAVTDFAQEVATTLGFGKI